MKRVVICSVAVIAVLAAAATVFGSHTSPAGRPGAPSGAFSLDDLQAKADKNKLPALEFEDRSLIFSAPAKP